MTCLFFYTKGRQETAAGVSHPKEWRCSNPHELFSRLVTRHNSIFPMRMWVLVRFHSKPSSRSSLLRYLQLHSKIHDFCSNTFLVIQGEKRKTIRFQASAESPVLWVTPLPSASHTVSFAGSKCLFFHALNSQPTEHQSGRANIMTWYSMGYFCSSWYIKCLTVLISFSWQSDRVQ